ncbi:hypothetical protein KML24007_04000 [Alistipes indistinctus]|uniref:hypothetical protein n=1 Tax=Alistipes indistinctus TaxID=626932 RepID=UPI0036F28CFD
MSAADFNDLTPAEFMYAWVGWMELEENRVRQAWERERWAVWILTSIQMEQKHRQPMTQMFPLPWETLPAEVEELTLDERRERVKQLLKNEKDI